MLPDTQPNSFACRKCGIVQTEESGASPGFVCEDCTNEILEYFNEQDFNTQDSEASLVNTVLHFIEEEQKQIKEWK